MKILCKIIGHKYSYDSKSQPTRCKCKRCDKKWMIVKNPKYDYTNIFKEPIFIWREIKN